MLHYRGVTLILFPKEFQQLVFSNLYLKGLRAVSLNINKLFCLAHVKPISPRGLCRSPSGPIPLTGAAGCMHAESSARYTSKCWAEINHMHAPESPQCKRADAILALVHVVQKFKSFSSWNSLMCQPAQTHPNINDSMIRMHEMTIHP
jgi:hypothetical protein